MTVADSDHAYTRAWLLARFNDIAERALEGEPVLARDGAPTGATKHDGALALRAYELIGKLQGFFTEREEKDPYDDKSDDELDAELGRILGALAELGVDIGAYTAACAPGKGPAGSARADEALPLQAG